MSVIARYEFLDVFSEQERRPKEFYLEGISKKTLLEFSVMLIGVSNQDSTWQDIKVLLFEKWFQEGNYEFAQRAYDKLQQKSIKSKREGLSAKYTLLTKIGSLKLIETVFKAETLPDRDLLDSLQIEINLFTLILIINEEDNSKDDIAINSVETHGEVDYLVAMYITYSLGQYELINTSEQKLLYEFITQLVKALHVFEFLESKNKNLLDAFLNNYECENFQSYISRFIPLAFDLFDKSKIEFENHESRNTTIVTDPLKKEDSSFLEKFIITPNTIDEDVDFRLLRASPLAQLNENTFLIINNLFIIQKIYNGLYFDLKDINDKLTSQKVKNFRQFFTYEYTEKYLLYSTLRTIYGHRSYIQLSGEEIEERFKFRGGPDYYIRNGNIIYLFESKDIFISSATKSSYNFSIIKDEIDKKLVNEAGIPQIINNIRNILNLEYPFDKKYNNKCKIYPILVTNRAEIDTPGINTYLQSRFEEKLELLKQEGFNIENVKNITIINIDAFLLFQNSFHTKKIILSDSIDEYHKYVNNNKHLRARTREEYGDIQSDKLNSYYNFLFIYSAKNRISILHEIQRWGNKYFKGFLD